MHAWSCPATYTEGIKYEVEIKACYLFTCEGLNDNLATSWHMAREVARRASYDHRDPNGVGPAVFYNPSLPIPNRGSDFFGYETRGPPGCDNASGKCIYAIRRNFMGEYVG